MKHDLELVRANNGGPFTLEGTNTWVVGRDPAWVVDPGPALPEHVSAVRAAVAARGGLGGIALTHRHADHAEAVPEFEKEILGGPSPFTVIPTPGHTPDHVAFVTADGACFSGDAVLGHGSVFVAGELAAYLASLLRLRGLPLRAIYPGHGPVVDDPAAKLDDYVAHRLERERKLLVSLAAGDRTVDAMLDAAWDDAPANLRRAAAVTLRAHLEKLQEEGRLPDGVEWPRPLA